jgi:hypothetical protein
VISELMLQELVEGEWPISSAGGAITRGAVSATSMSRAGSGSRGAR